MVPSFHLTEMYRIKAVCLQMNDRTLIPMSRMKPGNTTTIDLATTNSIQLWFSLLLLMRVQLYAHILNWF